MQTTITTHIADLKFGLKRSDRSHIICDDDKVSLFLPIGIEFEMSAKDWLSVSKAPNSEFLKASRVADKIRKWQLRAPIRLSIDNHDVTISLPESLKLEVSIADWKKVTNMIVLDTVSA
jgi:hypothetical protein